MEFKSPGEEREMLFDVWAPEADQVTLHLKDRTEPMERDPARPGWWQVRADASDGTRYGFALGADGPVLPDPRSRRQPDGPDGLSAVVDHSAHTWEQDW